MTTPTPAQEARYAILVEARNVAGRLKEWEALMDECSKRHLHFIEDQASKEYLTCQSRMRTLEADLKRMDEEGAI